VQFLKEQEKIKGKKPAALATKPELINEAIEYHNAFIMLQGSRTADFQGKPNPIPLSEIEAFCNLYGYDTLDQRHCILHYARVCDKAYLEEKGVTHGNNPTRRSGQPASRARR
jgi:hypothetical protein